MEGLGVSARPVGSGGAALGGPFQRLGRRVEAAAPLGEFGGVLQGRRHGLVVAEACGGQVPGAGCRIGREDGRRPERSR